MAKKGRTKYRVRKVVKEKKVYKFLPYAIIGGVTIGTLSYLGFKKLWKGQGDNNNATSLPPTTDKPVTTVSKVKALLPKASRNDEFPLKRGSLGNRVTLLQQGLQSILGAEKFRQFTEVDGKFGPGTAKALQEAGYPTVVYKDDYDRITSGQLQIVFNPQELARNLYFSARAKNLSSVISYLKQIKDTTQYSAVNNYYKKENVNNGSTIVTDLLNYAFKYDSAAKEKIRTEFRRMGLKQDPTTQKWSLSGLNGIRDIVTITNTFVMDRAGNRFPVKRNTILGDEIRIQNGLTFFKTIDNTEGAVPTHHVRYVN